MRLDNFLKTSRLCPRRTVAQKLCDAGFVLLNGRPAKPAHVVHVEDELVIRQHDREIVARIIRVPGTRNVSRSDAAQLFEVLSEKQLELFSE
jgi:ribosomal 50S subunit-recycling heat shock protein